MVIVLTPRKNGSVLQIHAGTRQPCYPRQPLFATSPTLLEPVGEGTCLITLRK
jgi:hypothetical protein